MEITPAAAPPARDLTVVDRTLVCTIELHPRAIVRTGTPLVIEDNRWRAARLGEVPLLFALEPPMTNLRIQAAKAMVVETHRPVLKLGACRMENLTGEGPVQFVNDPAGRYLVVTPSRVYLG